MSKSKKNTKNSQQNSVRDCENNMNYAQDKKSDKTSDCQRTDAQNKNESNCR